MTRRTEAVEAGVPGTTRLFLWVWFALLVLTAVETFLAYEELALLLFIIVLMGISVVKSALIMSYFMHLRFERLGLFLIVVPTLVFMICLILIFLYPDSIRLLEMRP